MSNKRAVRVTQPKLRFETDGGTTIELWVLDVGQWAKLERRSFPFRADKSASLIYVTKGPGGFNATEYRIEDPQIWAWIQEHMGSDNESGDSR